MKEEYLIVIVILIMIAIGEFLYILSLRKSVSDIADELSEILSEDTNIGIRVYFRDKRIRKLASKINRELAELRKERLRLKQGDKELKQAVTNIAHDLRTPLTAINGYLELLEGEAMEVKAKTYLDVVRERTDALISLTNELFQYSIITSTSDELCPVELSLRKELEIAIAGSYSLLMEHNIVPEIELPEADVVRWLDMKALGRIFSNILSNAAKYSDGDLKIKLDENGQITFRNSAKQLSEVEAGRLFDRFYTVENARGATGLGLSIAKCLTERMNGTIGASMENGNLIIRLVFEDHSFRSA